MTRILFYVATAAFCTGLVSCGAYTPDKAPLVNNEPRNGIASFQGDMENRLVNHVQCEIEQGIEEAKRLSLPWVLDWGTTVTHSLTAQDQGGVSPGISLIQPLAGVTAPFTQYTSQSIGITGSTNALRTETIQYTFSNRDIDYYTDANRCFKYGSKMFMEGDLKIREFIFDHAELAAAGNASLSGKLGHGFFNTFTDEITFVIAYGGTFTPTWKLARFTANTSSNLLVAERTTVDDLVVTMGPLKRDQNKKLVYPLQLSDIAVNQHQARVQASAIAVSVLGQSH